ncbi:hypothetical protein B0H19DRAFT_1271002 [Mycena capillaripes]|nr:hypothetical protein B0H19DRAFT_1271002 [Mycena capillaripes]
MITKSRKKNPQNIRRNAAHDTQTYSPRLGKEEKAQRRRKAQAEYRAWNPDIREKQRIQAAERRAAVKAGRRRWDPPPPSKMISHTMVPASEMQSQEAGDGVSDIHSFLDPRARSDLTFFVAEREVSQEPAAGTSDSPTPDERLACSALTELAQGVTPSALSQHDNQLCFWMDSGIWPGARIPTLQGIHSRDPILEMAMQLSSIESGQTPLHFPPDFLLGDGPVSAAARAGRLPAGAASLSRVQELKLLFTGQIWVAETNAGKLTVPTHVEKQQWATWTPPTWDLLTYGQGYAINAWQVQVCKAGRAARLAGCVLGGEGEWELQANLPDT